MRICLHTIRELAPGFVGGTERIMIELAKELTFLGHDPFIVTTGTRGNTELEGIAVQSIIPARYRKPYQQAGFANTAFIANAIMRGSTSEQGLRALGDYVDSQLKEVRADVFHLNSFAASLFSEHTRGALVTNHENEKEYDRKWGAGFAKLLGRIVRSRASELQHASLLTSPSKHYASYYSKAFGLSVAAIRNGVSLTTFDRRRRRRSENRTVKKSPLSVLLPARFDPDQKGHDIAMAACKLLIERGFLVQLTFSGMRPDYRDRVKGFLEAAKGLGIGQNVHAKYFADIQTALCTCDVVVSPERFCSYGLSISEALALGIPTVLSDIPTHLEIASGYAHAKFFPTEDPEALATALVDASRVPADASDEEAVRFRIANDLRMVALELHKHYLAASQSRSGA